MRAASVWVAAAVTAALMVTAGCTAVVTGTGGPVEEPRSGLVADVLADECLLDAAQFGALLGEPVRSPAQVEVPREDGSSTSSCVAESEGDFPAPLASVNVYEPRRGTPAEFVRAAPAGSRPLPGVGEAAVLVDTAPGLTLQLAHARFVVTISVLDGAPPDAVWQAAALAVLAALP